MDELSALNPTCPYCWEPTEVFVEAAQLGSPFVEDCVVCCHPIRFMAYENGAGGIRIDADREND